MKRLLPLLVGVVALVAAVVLWRRSVVPPRPPTAPAVELLTTVLGFPGATDWSSETECTDVASTDPCVGQWRHISGQIARVLVLPVPDPTKLAQLATRLQEQTRAQGGVADVVDNNGQQVIRLLQPMRDADHADATLVGFTYVLTAPDQHAVHMLTSSSPLAQEQQADQRLRDLLAFGAWLDPPGSLHPAP